MSCKPAVFFDRDGVINHDTGYLYKPEDFSWVEGAVKSIKYFNDAGYLVVVITNQSGVARGYYSEADVENLHKWISEELSKQNTHIDAFYYCPHHTEGKEERYRVDCNCRKPEKGMIEQAVNEWPIDMEKSFLVGDKQSDMDCAQKAGIKGYRFSGGDLYRFLRQEGCITE